MTKKGIILIIVSVCVVIITVTCLVVACWRPYTLKESACIALQFGEKHIVLTPEDKAFAETQKRIKRMLNSSGFSIMFANEQVKMQCSDKNVADYKASNDIWIEIFPVTGKYHKLFFVIKEDGEKQFIRVFATQTEVYDNGTFLLYNSCNCKRLIEHLQLL